MVSTWTQGRLAATGQAGSVAPDKAAAVSVGGVMIFYAIVGFFLSDIFSGLPTVTDSISYWATSLPYLVYPLWLVPTLLLRCGLFTRGNSSAV